MGCVSSALLEEDGAEDDRRRIISHHHIVSLTSSTYGILTSPRAYCSSSSSSTALGSEPLARCAPPPPPPLPPPPPTTARQQAAPAPKPESQPQAEVINSWELMAGLVDPSTPGKPTKLDGGGQQRRRRIPLRAIDGNSSVSKAPSSSAVVLYTTSLRGVRVTFEACNAVRAALQAHGVAFRERDVSMDRGFRDELRSRLGLGLGGGRAAAAGMLPRLFVRGRHVGGAEDVLRLDEEGLLARLLEGLPRARGGAYCCDGCGGMRFLPCFDCSGSRKLAVALPVVASSRKKAGTVVVRCGECNENGLVLCPICS
ncbi:uncharacterized protein At5g39865 [Zea mays]|jgi:glutaredoxin domain-containing cysteine-rich protein 1|uniref:Glutaredoxin family protein n=1 Tax=Zea mays TaxID=4577 RepID=K7UCP1_MAIZE|nr:uncharacterized protein At5g39865 [Zea mays]AQK61268.1 Glutaredoxin family protein [Zea mays]|eukprot:XP_008680041.1 uncharacterized protein At5g39865 [Zea mays]